MTLEEKIQEAFEYVNARPQAQSSEQWKTSIRNDAANIIADDFDEYCAIWEAFKNADRKDQTNDIHDDK